MPDLLTLALAQTNPIVGDVADNADGIRAGRATAREQGADLVVLGELAIAGYPPEDLVLKLSFLEAIERAVEKLAAETGDGGPAIILGAPWRIEGALYNAALLLEGGRIAHVGLKHEIPNYGVFDEKRLFAAGGLPEPLSFRGARLGLMVCEDMWFSACAGALRAKGAEIMIVLNGSPFETDKPGIRLAHARTRVADTGLPLAYVNLIGGQDELVFDGASFVLGSDGDILAQAPSWREHLLVTRWRKAVGAWTCAAGEIAPEPDPVANIYGALVTGLGDYVNKNIFPGVLIGLSGGIDSALTAALAVDALGADRVHCVLMPSPYTSRDSIEDATEVARRLGCRLDTIPIVPAMEAFETMLRETFVQHPSDTTEENIQARARGITLMALSNKFDYMVLSTGNKSEMSVGYATLYGDMCGGFAVLKDVYKTTVYRLAGFRNAHRPPGARGPEGEVIPPRVLTKAPSAELKPNQTDQDTLPPYEVLDGILESLIERERGVRDTVAQGFDEATVRLVWRMLDRAEYKRRQAPPGVKITSRAFGRDRRYPIVNGFTDHP
ncbi:MAG: NAD+ synthase [Rhodospirillales bacterium RIFCSPLOWO2_12_FULL_67_15]|nr:MAG: NAD+ synthase [Rhodospirillales bacterium RIFCSPLOWO2_12_FULL_67_15]